MFKTLNLNTGEKKEICSDKISHNFNIDIDEIEYGRRNYVKKHVIFGNKLRIKLHGGINGFIIILRNELADIKAEDVKNCHLESGDVKHKLNYIISAGTLNIYGITRGKIDRIMLMCAENYFKEKNIYIEIKGRQFTTTLQELVCVSTSWDRIRELREQFKLTIKKDYVYDKLSDTTHKYEHSCYVLA